MSWWGSHEVKQFCFSLPTGEELICAQVIPIFEHLWKVAGFNEPPLRFDAVSYAAMKRMAGNSFNQCCASTFLAYALARCHSCE